MSKIYITGHKNPDMDSLCSAYAYAVLKNRIDSENDYIAVRCGHLNENVKRILTFLGIEPLIYKSHIQPVVGDVVLNSELQPDANDPISSISAGYHSSNPSVMPVYDSNRFCGLLSVDDIAAWVMSELSDNGKVDRIPSIREVMGEQEEPVLSSELYEEVKKKLSVSKKRGLAVFCEGEFVGFVTRRCFLKAPRYNVILVDHNEPKQSIRGIENANIIEIIDHHRIDSVHTDVPILIDAEPIGSTCTIVFRRFISQGVTPDVLTARALLAGIVSDTLILRSPTTTSVDKEAAEALAKICGVDVSEFGFAMFANIEGLKSREPSEAIGSDFKLYTEGKFRFGIGQCEVTTLMDLDDYVEEYLDELESYRRSEGLDWAVLMITDILRENSVLLATEHNINKSLQYSRISLNVFDMPGVMSRKKQLLPELLSVVTGA